MTPLRQNRFDGLTAGMIDAMQVRGFSVRTHQSYLAAVTDLARYYHRSLDRLTPVLSVVEGVAEVRAFFLYPAKERHLSGASCRLYLNALRFFHLQVLECSASDVELHVPKRAQRIPELLTRREVGRILSAAVNRLPAASLAAQAGKHRMLLTTCYGCGLRLSEVTALKVRHIDGERRLLRVEQGKGAKDRQVILSETLLNRLRDYWRTFHPSLWLFPGRDPETPLTLTTAQKAFQTAKRRAGVDKIGGIHSLRHACATRQLEAGMPVHCLQRLMGHRDIHSTLRYVHWVPDYREGHNGTDLIADPEAGHV